MRLPAVIGVVAATAIAVGCGSSPTAEPTKKSSSTGYEKVLAQVNGLGAKERLDKLAKLAEAEGGQLSLYTSLTSDVEDAVAGEFEDAFDVDVSVYRSDSETVLKRLSEEHRARFRGADVVETNGPELFNLNREGVLVDYKPAALPTLVEGSDFDGWTATRFNKFVVSWNTKLIKKGEQPKSWEDLADPRFDGKLALELGDVEWYKTLFEWFREQGKSEEETQKIFEDMARGGSIIKGHTVMGELMAAGEAQVEASNYSYLVQQLQDKGAPVAWKPTVEPVVSRPNGVGLVSEAKHPATAMLFVEWLLGDGQKVLAEERLDPARKDLATAKGTEEIRVDIPALIAKQDEWTDRYEQLTKLGEAVKK
ncbi:MAG TPA: extracellular solute-binding protein [Solirubrobacteraceae bacterium]